MKIIEITVTPKGEVIVQTRGFTGTDCRQASRLVETALGQTTCETMTTESYQTQPTEERIRQSS